MSGLLFLTVTVTVTAALFFSNGAMVMGRRHGHSHRGVLPVPKKTYIVHVRQPENVGLLGGADERKNWYESKFLPKAKAKAKAKTKTKTTDDVDESRLVYSYDEVMSGFAARLSEEEVKGMEKVEGFVQAYPDRVLPLLTTHTPDFLGLQLGKGLWKDSKLGEGVIVGVLDTGISPGHPSFHDDGMPPPPAKWKGTCESPHEFCNNKVIGARIFTAHEATGADNDGHGTHTAGTAAGAPVKNAAALGNANGTAVGMAPGAHLAIYKVCSSDGCATSDILAGLDAAVKDGVDVLSLSLGGSSVPFFSDGVAIGSFGAMEKGVFVSCAGGNSGPSDATLSNEAPWMLTVAASTMDRVIRATVKLGNGQEFNGESLFRPHDFSSSSTMLPLVIPGGRLPEASYCAEGSLDGIDVRGKMVLCEMGGGLGRAAKGEVVKAAGGAAMILLNQEENGYTTFAEAHVIPAAHVNSADASKIKAYVVGSSDNPTATIIFKGTLLLGASPSPAVAYFSSRGPSQASPGILKPDITGPGVNILAAWPFQVGQQPKYQTTPHLSTKKAAGAAASFNVISGTSMSTPHLSGIAALLKSAHPDWSPAAIKSAIMTTSDIVGQDGKPINDERLRPASFFSMGAGHVNPSKASDPGLVYDLAAADYISYLCGLGYTDAQMESIIRRRINCSEINSVLERELNYPSISVTMKSNSEVAVNRTVTNVGEAEGAYSVEVDEPGGVKVDVIPKKLEFSKLNEKKSFTVTFTAINGSTRGKVSQGNLKWVSEKHIVRSPISISLE